MIKLQIFEDFLFISLHIIKKTIEIQNQDLKTNQTVGGTCGLGLKVKKWIFLFFLEIEPESRLNNDKHNIIILFSQSALQKTWLGLKKIKF